MLAGIYGGNPRDSSAVFTGCHGQYSSADRQNRYVRKTASSSVPIGLSQPTNRSPKHTSLGTWIRGTLILNDPKCGRYSKSDMFQNMNSNPYPFSQSTKAFQDIPSYVERLLLFCVKDFKVGCLSVLCRRYMPIQFKVKFAM